MEMTAAIKALEYFDIKNIVLYTDSNYLKLGITNWVYGWKKIIGLIAKRESKNKSYWITLDKLNNYMILSGSGLKVIVVINIMKG